MKGHIWENAMVPYLFTCVFCQRLNWGKGLTGWWSVERELIRDDPSLRCCLHRLLTIVSGSRSGSSGLHHFWEKGQGPQPQHKASLKHTRPLLSEATLLFLPVLFTGWLKQACSQFLSWDWLFIGLLSPSCFRLTWLMQFLFLKSPTGLLLKTLFVCPLRVTKQTTQVLRSCLEKRLPEWHMQKLVWTQFERQR